MKDTISTLDLIMQNCHDNAIGLQVAIKCGKTLPSLVEVRNLYRLIGKLAETVKNVQD